MKKKASIEATPTQLIVCGLILLILGNAAFPAGSTVKIIFSFLGILGLILFLIGTARLLFKKR